MRFRLTIEYDGTPYVGWQRQDNGASVQGALEAAIEKLSGESVTLFGAGRTDAGVHALAQVAHFDLAKDWPAHKLRDGLNFHLKGEAVAVLEARRVGDEFDARFCARARHYLYRIINRRSPLTLEAGRAWRIARPLDIEAMNEAARSVLGRHDFTTFRSVHCQAASPVKTLDGLAVSRTGPVIEVLASARSFLHNPVRSLVGGLKRVGEGAWPVARLRETLDARDRAQCAMLAPAHGLYLVRVDYDKEKDTL